MGYVFASHTPMYMRQGILIIDVFVHPDPVGSESILRLLKAPKGSLNKKLNCFGRGYGLGFRGWEVANITSLPIILWLP